MSFHIYNRLVCFCFVLSICLYVCSFIHFSVCLCASFRLPFSLSLSLSLYIYIYISHFMLAIVLAIVLSISLCFPLHYFLPTLPFSFQSLPCPCSQVPNPKLPFLGFHFTPCMNGDVWLGPNALLALSREGYNFTDFNWNDVKEMARFG